ncbi:MAG: hypothetical protein PUF31_06510 [Oscillospiraceae bacterium]|nr:hypothetical protein [Oscillospiraceae bacterium]MDD6527433.1 hypothetical protein [Oscillospiraceae bacterium]
MFSYTTSLKADNSEFKRVCSEVEKINGIRKHEPIVDVDGSVIQEYTINSKRIIVQNDYEVDAVYIDSDIDLSSTVKSVV